MRIPHAGRQVAAVLLVAPALALAAGVGPGEAAGGTNLVVNGGFESSLTGWTAVQSKLTVASDGDGGGRAAKAAVNGKSKRPAYGLTSSAAPVTGPPPGETYLATARVRSATPGKTVCVVVRELTAGGATVQSQQGCAAATAAWASLPAATLTVAGTDHSLSVTVQQADGVAGDTFETDNVSLVDADTTAPSVPDGVTATATSATSVSVAWQAASDPGGGVAGYVVSRDGSTVATVGAGTTAYTDAGLAPSSTYTYTVTAFDYPRNSSAASAPATVTTPAPPPDDPPTPPGSLTATVRSSAEIDLAWTASSDTDATGVAGYVVTRNGSTLATLGPTSTGYVDFAVSPSTTYTYAVVAFDSANNSSAPSDTAQATTPAGPAGGVVDSLWHLDETSGATMVDSGATPHPGILHNVLLGQPGDPAFPGTSYGFNGTSSFIDVGTAADLNAGSKDVRFALSLNTTTVPAQPDYDLFRKGEYPGTEYKSELQPNGEFSCEFRTQLADGTVKGFTLQPAIDLHDGRWHRITCSKVGSTMTVNIDGRSFTRSISGSISNANHLIIGAYSETGSGDYYKGLLDEVSFRIG